MERRSKQGWWVTANAAGRGGGWDQFFNQHLLGPYPWGGPEWIRSRTSIARIREMRKGDLIFAYQAPQGLVGLTRLASDGYAEQDGGATDVFDLDPSERLSLPTAVPFKAIRALPGATAEIEAVRMRQGTVFALTPKGIDLLVRAMTEANPALRKAVHAFI